MQLVVRAAGVLLLAAIALSLLVRADDVPVNWQLLDDGDPDQGVVIIAHDSARQRTVLFTSAFTWELLGENWLARRIPQPNLGGSMVFDSARGVIVLYGNTTSLAGETWEYAGSSWVQRLPSTTPTPRFSFGMAYDSARGRTVLFGGFDAQSHFSGETWEYNGTNWTRIFPTTSPTPRAYVSLAYDSARQKIVLFGGRGPGALGDTWEYNGTTWTKRTPTAAPSPRFSYGMAYDPVRQKTVLYGGATSSTNFTDTWEWNGTQWTLMSPAQSPGYRTDFRLVFDTARNKVLGQGGTSGPNEYNDTWVYNGSTWTRIAISALPANRFHHGMAYSSPDTAVVLYGGKVEYPNLYPDDTWHYANGAWSLQQGAGTPSSVFFPLAYDPMYLRIVGFSGNQGDIQEYKTDLWQSTPGGGPGDRFSHGWAAAPALGGVVLFGGYQNNTLMGDTWVLQGLSFEQRFPAVHPTPRYDHAMAFDEARGKVILYGGYRRDGWDPSAETWSYDGTSWQLLSDPSPPGTRVKHSLVYDSARSRIVMFGGGPIGENVTWEFDGTSWIPRTTSDQPAAERCDAQLAYDPVHDVVILFGGHYCGEVITYDLNDTWAYGADPDGDGVVGKLDNCVSVANANQANGDGDAAGDVCDCAPADGGAFAVPTEVTSLMATGKTLTTVAWQDMAPNVGANVVYDLTTGSLITLRSSGSFAGATCLSNNLTIPSEVDSRQPPAGDGFYYLARASNVCGTGTYGSTSNGANRSITACP